MYQVIKKKSSSALDIFKMTDEERIKEYMIVFDIPEQRAAEYNKVFNMYADTYFKQLRHVKFYQSPGTANLNTAIYNIAELLDKTCKFHVDQYPSVGSVLVNFTGPVLLRIGTYERYSGGQYYLRGVEIPYLTMDDRRTSLWLPYSDDNFIDNFLGYVKFPHKDTRSIDLLKVKVFRKEPIYPIIPLKLDREIEIPKNMLILRRELIFTIKKLEKQVVREDTLRLEDDEYSTEIQSNEIGRDYDEGLFNRLITIYDSELYMDIRSINIYELIGKILVIADGDEIAIRDITTMAYLIYLNIHDDILHLNPTSPLVIKFRSSKKGTSLLEYYIEFMVAAYISIFGVNYRSEQNTIKSIYSTFVQTVRKKPTFKFSRSVLITPNDYCGNYSKMLESYVVSGYDKKMYDTIQEIQHMLWDPERADSAPSYIWNTKVKITRSYVSKVSGGDPYFRSDLKVLTDKGLKDGKVVPVDRGSAHDLPEIIISDYLKPLIVKIGSGVIPDIENFGLLKKKMARDEKNQPKTFSADSYQKTALQFLKTSLIELIHQKKEKFADIYDLIGKIEIMPDTPVAVQAMRSLLFRELLALDADKIISFLKEQLQVYEYYKILEYDVEYKKQKKIEQYEKRNVVYYSLTPEEKIVLGIDQLHGEERINLLDRLVQEREGSE